MRKKFTGAMVGLILMLVSATALSQVSPPFQPLQPPTTTVTQRYSSERYSCSFLYPQGWKIQEDQQNEIININHPQGFTSIAMWRITENIDPQTYLQNKEAQLKQQVQNLTVTSRNKVKINSIDTLRVDAQSTSPQGAALVHTLLVLYQNNLAKFMVVAIVLKEQYTNLSPLVEQTFNSITLSDGGRTVTTSQKPQTSGDGSEGIKILRDSARGADSLPLPQRTPPKDWVHFAHPTIFMLKLIHPPDWKGEIMQDPSGYYGGLKIISPDDQANLYVFYTVNFGAMTLDDGIKEGIYLLTGSYSQVEIVVKDDLRKVCSAMWPGAECIFVAFRSQEKVGVLLCVTYPLGGQGTVAATSVQLKGCIGPANKFDSLVKEVFYKVFGWVGAGGYTTPAPRG